MKIKDMPFFTRPGVRLKRGQELNDAELLSIILERGNKDENAIDLANRLLSSYNLHRMSGLAIAELKEILKDEVKALKIQAMCRLFERFSKLEKKGFKQYITSPSDVYNMLVDELGPKKKEHLYVLLLDSKNKIIKRVLVSVGILNNTLIHPREIFKEAIKESAHSIILVHNHPSGDTEPSEEDEEITKKLMEIGELIKIKVLDHVIIGKDEWKSIVP